MPRNRKYTKKNRRKTRNNSWTRFNGPGLTSSSPLGKSFKMYTKYVETAVSLNPGVGGTPAHYVFSANGVYDPNVTGTGHQVLGFDQIMPMYDHYTVIGSRIKIIGANTTATNNQYLILSLSDSAVSVSDIRQLIENGNCRYNILSVDQGDHGVETLTLNFNPKRFFSHKSVMDNRALQGSIAGNPSEQAYYHITVAPMDGSSDSGVVRVHVEIEYIVVFTEPKKLVLST